MDNKFISRNNINLIWDILSDNDQFAKLAENRIESIQTALKEDMELFYLSNKSDNLNIMDLNKKFISQVTNALKKKDKSREKKIVSFEETLDLKKNEMNKYLIPKTPNPINFEDEITDEKIESIDDLIKGVIEHRKFDIKPEQNNLSKQSNIAADSIENRINILEDKIEKIITIINSLMENRTSNDSLFDINEFNTKDDDYHNDSDNNSEITYKVDNA